MKNNYDHKELGQVASKYLETLQRSNEQLVKIAGLVHKRTATKDGLTSQDKEDIFNAEMDGEGSMAGGLVVNAASAAKVIPASLTADLMSGMGGGQNFAPTTIVNSAPTSSSTIMASNSLNPISQKYFRN